MKKCEHNDLSLEEGKYKCQNCGNIISERNGRRFETKNGARFCPKHGAYGFLNNPFEDCNICYINMEKET